MKKSLSILLISLLGNALPILADVTFTVNVPSGTKQCYVVGALSELSAWSAGTAVPMTKVAENVGKKIVIVANLKPNRICNVKSEGMLLAATNNACGCKVIFVDDSVPEGTAIH